MGSLKKFYNFILTKLFSDLLRSEIHHSISDVTTSIIQQQNSLTESIKSLSEDQTEILKKLNYSIPLSKTTPLLTPHHRLEELFDDCFSRLCEASGVVISKYSFLVFYELLTIHEWPEQYWRLAKDIFSLQELYKNPRKNKNGYHQSPKEPNRLKILYVCGLFPSMEHGGGLRLFDILTELVKNHEVDLFTHYNSALDEVSLNKMRHNLNAFEITDLEGINFTNLAEWLKSRGLKYGDYDVIQVEYPNAAELIEPIKKAGGKHVGFTFMECVTKSSLIEINNCIKNSALKKIKDVIKVFWYHLKAEKEALAHADFCIAMTPEDQKVLEAISPVPIEIIPTCISTHEILDAYESHKQIIPEKNSVAFVGYFDHSPNIDAMIWFLRDIHPVIKEAIPDYKFFIIGRGDTSKLQQIAKEHSNVIFSGRVDNIVPHLLKAKVCIAPLISGAGVRGKLNQYSVLNRPTVTTSIGNKGLGYTHNESIMIADTAADTASCIIKLLTDDPLYEKIRTKARSYALQNFTWPNQIDKLLKLYTFGLDQ